MKFTIQQLDLARIVARASGAADRKATMPILGTIRLGADACVTASATDLYIGTDATAQADIAEAGAACVTAKALGDVVRALPQGSVSVTHAKGALELRSGKSKYKLATIDAEDFPARESPDGAEWWTVPGADLSSVLASSAFAASTDETRPHLASVLLESSGGRLRGVSAGGHRLAIARDAVDAPDARALVPSRAIAEIRRLSDVSESVDVAVVGDVIFVRADGTAIGAKLAQDAFVPYEKLIQTSHARDVRIRREDAMAATKRVALLAADKSAGIRVELSPGALILRGVNDRGEAIEELSADYAGQAWATGANARYLLDALGAMRTEDVVVKCGDELAPVLIEQASSHDVEVMCIVMPMRI